MSFKNSCFISYRRREPEREFATRLHARLNNEMAILLDKSDTVWIDEPNPKSPNIKVGDQIESEVATSLCQSVCRSVRNEFIEEEAFAIESKSAAHRPAADGLLAEKVTGGCAAPHV